MRLIPLVLVPIGFGLLVTIIVLDACSALRQEAPPIEIPDGSLSWKDLEWSIDVCKRNGGVKRVFVGGRTICSNGARFVSPKNNKEAKR